MAGIVWRFTEMILRWMMEVFWTQGILASGRK